MLIKDFGLENDAHAGKWHRQVSFLAEESIETMRAKGLDVVAGNFAENITTEGVDLARLPVGSHLKIGKTELIISQLGKICHTRCAIYHQAGDCVMPREGIFAVVIEGGRIKVGDTVTISGKRSKAAAFVGEKDAVSSYGDTVVSLIKTNFGPAFVRVDTISTREGGNLSAILKDLTETQKIEDIIIYDPAGGLGLALAGLERKKGSEHRYLLGDSTIHYCRQMEQIDKA